MDRLVKAVDVFANEGSSRAHHALNLLVLAQVFDDQGRLEGQLARRHQYQRLNFVIVHVDLLHEWNSVRGGLSSSILRFGNNVASLEQFWDRSLLNRTREFKSHLEYSLHTHKTYK